MNDRQLEQIKERIRRQNRETQAMEGVVYAAERRQRVLRRGRQLERVTGVNPLEEHELIERLINRTVDALTVRLVDDVLELALPVIDNWLEERIAQERESSRIRRRNRAMYQKWFGGE